MARAKEYAFLLYAMFAATVYAVAHDHVTATISPEYFLYAKGLAQARQSFRCVSGVVNAFMQIGTATALTLGVVPYRVWRFVIVWAIHVGSYAGALLGSVAAAVLVVRRRNPSRPADPTAAATDGGISRPRSTRLRSLAAALLGYLAICLAARLGYRVLLYPAPPDAPFVPPDGAKLLSMHLSKASRIHVPTLVVHGDADEVVPFAMGRRVASAIPGAALRVVRGGHHNDLFAIDPRDLEDAIADEVKR